MLVHLFCEQFNQIVEPRLPVAFQCANRPWATGQSLADSTMIFRAYGGDDVYAAK